MVQSPSRAAGHIALVQESRFRLITDDGRGMLLTLSQGARTTPEDLWEFHRRGTRVEVEYAGEPNMADGVAERVRPA